jgi:hypothetical protein
VIYQARTLYNVINNTVASFKDNCPVEDNISARLANTKPINNINVWNANIYPNPANDEAFITTNSENEDVVVVITDVNGRVVFDNHIKTSSFKGNLKLSLKDGIYFVTLSNSKNDKVIKKLVIVQ